MTTLPQTTPARLPATSSGSASVPAAATASSPQSGVTMTGADIRRVIRANLWLILLLVALGGVGGYFLNRELLKRWPEFTALGLLEIETSIMIDPVRETYNSVNREGLLVQQRTQAAMLKSEALFSEALQKDGSPLHKTNWYRAMADPRTGLTAGKDAKEQFRKNFKVTPYQDSALLEVAFSSADPADCVTILTEVVSRHLEQQNAQSQERYNAQLAALRALKLQLESDLNTQLRPKVKIAQEKLAKQGMPTGLSSATGTKEHEMRALFEQYLKVSVAAAEAADDYERVVKQVKESQMIPEVEKAIEQDPMIAGLTREVMSLEITHSVQGTSLPEESKVMTRLSKQIEVTKGHIDARREELRSKYRDQYAGNLRTIAEQAEARRKKLDAEVKKLRDEIAEAGVELTVLMKDMETEKELRERLGEVERKLADVNAFSVAAKKPLIKWAANGQPQKPEIPSFPKLSQTMAVCIALGLGLALGIAFLREFMDDTVRTPRDVSRVGQMTLLGIIADATDDPQASDSGLPIFDAPHSLTAEQFRQVRTRMSHASPLDTTRSIMVTGPRPQDGKTTVAANLAAGLALNGRKILLVDSNFRRPDLHRLFSLANDRGFSDVLNGSVAFDDVVQATRVPNLSLMTSGPKPMNATELFESQLLMDFVERALEEYDHVIFDSGPFLIVSEAVAMAPRVDGVVTVVRAHEERRGELERMRDLLKQIKAENIGVVLNAVRAHGAGYYRRNIKAFYKYQQSND